MLNQWFSRWNIPLDLKPQVLCFLSAALLLTFGLLVHPLVDPDVFIHLRDGRVFLESGLNTPEAFAYTIANTPMEKAEWLFRIGIYWVWKTGGYSLVILAKACLMTLALFLLFGLGYRRWPHLGIAISMLGVCVFAAWTRVIPERPQIFTYLFLPLCLHLLENYYPRCSAFNRRTLLALASIPLLVVLWANLHPGFIVLLVFLTAYAIDFIWQYFNTWDKARLVQAGVLVALIAGSLIAGAATPLGFSMYAFIAETMNNPLFLRTIIEWLPPVFSEKPFFFILLGTAWVLQVLAWRNTRVSDVLLLMVFSYLAVQSRRNIPLFLLAVLPAMIANVRQLWQARFPKFALSLEQRRKGFILGTVVLGGIFVGCLGTGYAFRFGLFPDYHPSQALAWMQQHPLTGRLFAPLHWGGYITWETRGKQTVFMDGRLPAFAGKIYPDYTHIIYGDPACLKTLDEYNIQILLLSSQNYFRTFQVLAESRQWTLVYWDHVSEIFVRKTGPNQALAKTQGYEFVDPNATPYFHPQHISESLSEIRRAQKTSPRSYLPYFFEGDLLLEQQQWDAARKSLDIALSLSPSHAHTLFDLGRIALHQGQGPTAESFFRKALGFYTDKAHQARTLHYLALCLGQEPGKRKAALQLARRAAALLPDWPANQSLLRDLEAMP